jgi:hopanoid C-3 methylase
VKTSWGCWYDCNFCFTTRITGGKVYARSPESIVEEIAQIPCEDIYIVDDIFLIQPRRLERIAGLLREKALRKKFLVYGRADFIAENEEIIREWSDLGLTAVIVGLEAATDPELKALEKECTVDHNRRAVEVLRRQGVDTYGSLILQAEYGPGDFARVWRFIEETGLYYVNISPMTPLPGTRIWKEYEGKLTVSRKAYALWDLSHPVLPTAMPLKLFYRSLLRLYAGTVLDLRRAKRLTLRTRPPIWSGKYLRLWLGSLRVAVQLWNAHRHHATRAGE